MPKPLNVNWDLAKGLYLQGINMAEVSRRTGISYDALRAKASRCGWRETVTALSQDVTVQSNKTLAERGKAWTDRVAGLVEKRMNYLEKLNPAKLKLRELDELTRITDLTDRTARRTFGLDVADQGAHVTLHVQAELAQAQPRQLVATSDEIVDVETELKPSP